MRQQLFELNIAGFDDPTGPNTFTKKRGPLWDIILEELMSRPVIEFAVYQVAADQRAASSLDP